MRNLDEIKKINDTFYVSRSTDGMNEHLMDGGVPFFEDTSPIIYHKKSDLIRAKSVLIGTLSHFEEHTENTVLQYRTDNWCENFGCGDMDHPGMRYSREIQKLKDLYDVIEFKFAVKQRIFFLKDTVNIQKNRRCAVVACNIYHTIFTDSHIGYFDLEEMGRKNNWAEEMEIITVLEALIEYDYIARVTPPCKKRCRNEKESKAYWKILKDTGWEYGVGGK